jgi:hypothetical protein
MRLVLRKGSTQARIAGFERLEWAEDDYDMIDETTVVGRIYRERLLGAFKWRWFLQTVPATPPNEGVADLLDEPKTAFKARYEQVAQK